MRDALQYPVVRFSIGTLIVLFIIVGAVIAYRIERNGIDVITPPDGKVFICDEPLTHKEHTLCRSVREVPRDYLD